MRRQLNRNAQWKGAAAIALGAGLAGSSIYYSNYSSRRTKPLQRLGLDSRPTPRPKLHHFAVDAICGAVGEVAGLVAFYPLDTIKVKCQAGSISVRQALRETMALGPAAALRTLYAGMGSTALGAAAIGSIYLLTFYAAKRAGASLARIATEKSNSTNGTASTSSDGISSAAPLIASAAGAAASIVGSLIEAPIEAFKVRAQAGAGDGPMLASMARLVATQGLAPLYCSFVPFLLKAIPHDVAELFTFSQLSDALTNDEDCESNTSWLQGPRAALATLPPEAKDMLVGAASGAAAAIASMPFDVTFTKMNLGTLGVCTNTLPGAVSPGVGQNLAAFVNTIKSILAQGGGPQALFVGVVPRLLQTVPAGMVYWMAVEGTRRALESKFVVERPNDEDSPPAAHGHPPHPHAVMVVPPTPPAAMPVLKAQIESQPVGLLQALSIPSVGAFSVAVALGGAL